MFVGLVPALVGDSRIRLCLQSLLLVRAVGERDPAGHEWGGRKRILLFLGLPYVFNSVAWGKDEKIWRRASSKKIQYTESLGFL